MTQIGESYVGTGAEAAHLNTVLGRKGSAVEAAWATALATPRQGHSAFVTVLRPGLPVKPLTLFVNKAALTGGDHDRITWGPAQAGVASGVMWAVADGVIPVGEVDELLLIAAVWVDPAAQDDKLVYANNREATRTALEAGLRRTPDVDELLALREAPWNPFYQPES